MELEFNIGSEKYDASYDKIRYFISEESGITFIFSQSLAKIIVDSYDSSPIEKIMTLHNAGRPFKSVLNKVKNYYCYKVFLEKCLYHLAKE